MEEENGHFEDEYGGENGDKREKRRYASLCCVRCFLAVSQLEEEETVDVSNGSVCISNLSHLISSHHFSLHCWDCGMWGEKERDCVSVCGEAQWLMSDLRHTLAFEA